MNIKGRSISPGKVEGTVLKLDEPFSFLGGVNASTGTLIVGSEENIANKVFVFPSGKGSTVGSFVMYDLMVHDKAPLAIINRLAETIVTTGAVISSIPMVDMIDVDILRDGDVVEVNGSEGTISIKGLKVVKIVSSAIYVDGKVLMLRRPSDAISFPDTWSLVAGKVELEENLEVAAKREIFEETQIKVSDPKISMPPVYVRGENILWEVYPFLYVPESAKPVLNKENTEFRWMSPKDLQNMEGVVPLTYKVVSEMIANLK